MAEVCRKGTLGSVLAWRAASLLLIRLLFVLKPPLWERERGQAPEWACGGMTQEIHVFLTHGTFLWYLTTRIFYNATCSRNPKNVYGKSSCWPCQYPGESPTYILPIICVKLSINNHIVGLVNKNHIIRTRLMYHAAGKVEFQPFKRLYSQLTFFSFL